MMNAPADVGGLLESLRAAPRAERRALLQAAGDICGALQSLATHVERLAVSDVTAALEATELLIELSDELGSPLEQTRAQRVRGQALAYGGRFDEALTAYEQAARIATDARLAVEAARARMASMHALNSLGRFEESLNAGQAARAAFETSEEPLLAARADANLGATYRVLDRPTDALRHYDRARPALEHEPMACAQLDSNRGVSLMDLDRFEEAQRAFLAALPVFESHEMAWAAAIVEGNLAELATRQGRLQSALARFERARRFLEQDAADAELARIAAEQADTLAMIGALDDAQNAYQKAIPELENVGMAAEAAAARAGLGRVLVRLKRDVDAGQSLQRAAAEFASLGQPIAEARVNLILIELALSLGDVASASDLATRTLTALQGRPAMEAAARHALARTHLARGESAAADEQLTQAIALAESVSMTPLLADLHQARAELHSAVGRADRAIDEWTAAAECVESIRGTLQAERMRSMLVGGRMDVFESAAVALLDRGAPGDVDAAFTYVERSKGRALLDRITAEVEFRSGGSECTDAKQDQLITEFASVRADLNALYSRMADESRTSAAQDSHRRDEIREKQRRLAEIETRLSNVLGVAGLFAPPDSVALIRANIPKGTALIEYVQARSEVFAFVLTRDATHVIRRLATPAEIAAIAKRVRFQLERAMRPGATEGERGLRLIDEARRELAALGDTLFRSAREHVGDAAKLLFIPHGVLHSMPLHAMVIDGKYLVDSYEIGYAPSAGVWSQLATRRRDHADTRRQSGGGLIVGVADEHAPRIHEEVNAVAAVTGIANKLCGESATVAAVSSALRDAEIAHIACHGAFAPGDPFASGLRLHDRWMNLHDVFDLRLRARLITLSGCQTGLSAVDVGDELVGLLRGFLAAGANALLVSLWAVNDESTTRLMTTFYQHAAYNQPGAVAQALRAAQREVMKQNPHPYFWAPFVLLGDV